MSLRPNQEPLDFRDTCFGSRTGTEVRTIADALRAEAERAVAIGFAHRASSARATALAGEAIVEDLARIGAQSATWAEYELSEAFPEHGWLQRDPGAPYPLAPPLELDPPEPLRRYETVASTIPSRRPQPLGAFLVDWLQWLLARHLPRVYGALRRWHLIDERGPVRAASRVAGPQAPSCKSGTGELARL